METIALPPFDLDIEIDRRDLDRRDIPIPVYIVAKRLAQCWISEATRWEREDPITILDLASGEGGFSDIVCDFANARDKLALWVDRDENELREGIGRDKTFHIEILVGDLNRDDWFDRISGRRFDRITVGILHHHIDGNRYRQVLARAMENHLAPGGLALIVEVCSGLYAEITRSMVLPNLQVSMPAFAVFAAGTPKLVQSTVRHPRSGRQWTVEYYCAALAMPAR